MAETSIEWATHVWNPTTGCDRVSPGCDHCYALTLAGRLKGMGSAKYQRDGDPRTSGPGFGLTAHDDALTIPLRWREPRRVFVDSMSDLFHARVPREFVVRVWDVMSRTPQHTYQILTKRPGRMAAVVDQLPDGLWQLPLPNVWLGTSIESDKYVGRADDLRRTAAAVRFISAEPLLGPLDGLDLTGIDWLIAGGESGPNARPMHPDWARSLRDQCLIADVPFFFKQWGGRTPKSGGRTLDGRTWDEYPNDRNRSEETQVTVDV
jgi:protein gp37